MGARCYLKNFLPALPQEVGCLSPARYCYLQFFYSFPPCGKKQSSRGEGILHPSHSHAISPLPEFTSINYLLYFPSLPVPGVLRCLPLCSILRLISVFGLVAASNLFLFIVSSFCHTLFIIVVLSSRSVLLSSSPQFLSCSSRKAREQLHSSVPVSPLPFGATSTCLWWEC